MQSKVISSEQLRSISVDLETWAAAEKNNHSVAAASETQIVYTNPDFHKNPSETKLKKNQAVIVMAKKILTQAAQFAQTQEDFKNIIIGQKLPSLNKFIETGKLGDLKNEWEKLVEANDPDSEKTKILEKNRKEFINEASPFLPKGLALSEKSGAVSSMTHILNKDLLPDVKKEIEKSCEEGSGKELIEGKLLDSLFIKDVIRTQINYEVKNKNNHSNENEKNAEKIIMKRQSVEKHMEHLNNMFGGEKIVIETLSRIINQSLIRRVSDGLKNEIYGGPDSLQVIFNKSHEKDCVSNEITVRKDENEDAIVDVLQMEKYQAISIPPNYSKSWKINSGPLWSGAVNQENFGLRVAFSVRLSKEDLKSGVINPHFDALPTISICVKME